MQTPSDLSVEECERIRLAELLELESIALRKGYCRLAGMDEAGRGPLAGPVVAAICAMPKIVLIPGVNDSKQLSSKQRLRLFQELTSHPDIHYGLGIVSSNEIDVRNILEATKYAMKMALDQLKGCSPDYILIDGLGIPGLPVPNEKVIKGDSRSYLIAAASIIAKETRDRLMDEYHERWPEYGFNQHKGYGTALHRAAIDRYGPTPIHRMTFEPLKSLYPRAAHGSYT